MIDSAHQDDIKQAELVLRGRRTHLREEWKAHLSKLGLDLDPFDDNIETVRKWAQMRGSYERLAEDVLRIFTNPDNRISPWIHSTNHRVKSSRSVADKLGRKALDENKDKRRFITSNLDLIGLGKKLGNVHGLEERKGMTDLAGIRILHIYKQDWFRFDEFLLKLSKVSGGHRIIEIIERCAYLSEHDYRRATKSLDDAKKSLSGRGNDGNQVVLMGKKCPPGFEICLNHENTPTPEKKPPVLKVQQSDNNYTSVHYVLKCPQIYGYPRYLEVQIRSLAEEVWSEVQRQIAYPLPANERLTSLLGLLRRATDLNDELARQVFNIREEPLAIRWKSLVEVAKSAKITAVATETLEWTAEQIKKQGKEWLLNWTQARGDFVYYVPPCNRNPPCEPCCPMCDKKVYCDLCKNINTVLEQIRRLDSDEQKKKVQIKRVKEAGILGDLISDRVYLKDAVFPPQWRPRDKPDWKEETVYLRADSRKSTGEADRLVSSEDDKDEFDSFKLFFDKLREDTKGFEFPPCSRCQG